ncbi:MAG: hypothetical protein Q6373_012805 [Candidatus Sigynarchaeota archaeon]
MATAWKVASHDRWLRKNIKEDDQLIKKYRRSIATLEEKRKEIHALMDLFSNFIIGADGRLMLGRKEFQLAIIEDYLNKIKAYLKYLDIHLSFLALQALLLGKERALERAGYKVEIGEPDHD